MTMNRPMWDFGLRPWREYNGDLQQAGKQLHAYFQSIPPEERIWAAVLSSSIYEYFLRYLTASMGINPIEEFRLLIIPPPQMVNNMRIGTMQAYMVAEPWNTRAITGHARTPRSHSSRDGVFYRRKPENLSLFSQSDD
jgi:nitrate/nitrite transport system substrate-binding protein